MFEKGPMHTLWHVAFAARSIVLRTIDICRRKHCNPVSTSGTHGVNPSRVEAKPESHATVC